MSVSLHLYGENQCFELIGEVPANGSLLPLKNYSTSQLKTTVRNLFLVVTLTFQRRRITQWDEAGTGWIYFSALHNQDKATQSIFTITNMGNKNIQFLPIFYQSCLLRLPPFLGRVFFWLCASITPSSDRSVLRGMQLIQRDGHLDPSKNISIIKVAVL